MRFSPLGCRGDTWRKVVAKIALVILAFNLAAVAVGGAAASETGLIIHVDLSQQSLRVMIDDQQKYAWPVSTARRGYRTPLGRFHPIRLERVWYSTKYDNAPMPHAIFFRGGYAIHGSYEVRTLGRPVSHGCVRLDPRNARLLFDLVLAYGRSATLIVIAP